MRLAAAIQIYAGGPGSGCQGPNCGRPSTGGDVPAPPVKEIPAGKTTEDVWKDPKTGEWEPNREAWHQALAEKALEGLQPAVGRAPVAIVMGGGTASGKSTLARRVAGDNRNFLHVDSDAIKSHIPEYEEFKKQEAEQPAGQGKSKNSSSAAARVHEESSYVSKLELAKGVAKKLDIIYDATSSGKGVAMMINRLAAEGYDLHLVFADVPEKMAVTRAESRAANPDSPGFGRRVPREAVHNTHVLSAANFVLMKDSPVFKSVRLYDMSASPNLIYSRTHGEQGGVRDKAKWKYYKNKAAGRA